MPAKSSQSSVVEEFKLNISLCITTNKNNYGRLKVGHLDYSWLHFVDRLVPRMCYLYKVALQLPQQTTYRDVNTISSTSLSLNAKMCVHP